MKKNYLFIIVLFALISCQENVTFNSPAFQAQKDNVLWKTVDSKATLASNGSLTIVGFTKNETLSLKLPNITSTMIKQNDPQSYVTFILGSSDLYSATYSITDTSGTITYAAGNGVGEGQIVITDYDTVNKTVSGTFKINVVNNTLFNPTLKFQYGNFYKVSFN